jgi:esterase/lipase superfamily enzyme
MLVFGTWGYPVLIFPTTMGRFYESKDFKLVESVRWFVETGKIKLYCIDSVDRESWYGRHLHPGKRIWNHELYDRFLSRELVPSIQKECNVQKIGVAGPSFGGFHALNFAFRHPDQVGHLFTMGAAFNVARFLGGFYNDHVYYNNPPDFIPNAQNPEFYRMNIVLGTSAHDFCRGSNEQMSGILNRKGIRHWLDIRPWGDHDWPVWREQFPHYLSLI